MDQSTANGQTKSNWREKLGLGGAARQMPKIADEFKPDVPAVAGSRPQPVPAAKQPVTKPAPMAPRAPVSARPGPSPAPKGEAEASLSPDDRPAAGPAERPMPASAERRPAPAERPAGGGGLAERLKAQREAAEKLAKQRISLAREKAEPQKPPAQAPAPADKPKFTFADEEIAAAKRETPVQFPPPPRDLPPAFQPKVTGSAGTNASPAPPPITPPRPALGGERPIANGAGSETRRGPPPLSGHTPGYRPLDPPVFQPLRRANAEPAPRGNSKANADGAGPSGRAPARREYLDEYRRRSEPELRGDDRADERRAEPRRSPPARARRPAPAYDDDDVFEDSQPPRRRASAQDYKEAYSEYERGYEGESRRRSSGPWLILLALLVVLAVFGTGLWYYYLRMKPVTMSNIGNVPLVTAPSEPAKVAPDTQAGNGGSAEMAPATAQKKKIYDRILGDTTLEGGKMAPTEEAPKPVEAAPPPPAGTQSSTPLVPVSPTGGNNASAIPVPQPSATRATNEIATPAPEPLPLPPPPGDDTQGSLPQPDARALAAKSSEASTEMAQVTPMSASAEPPAPSPPAKPVETASRITAETDTPILPAPETQPTPTAETTPASAEPLAEPAAAVPRPKPAAAAEASNDNLPEIAAKSKAKAKTKMVSAPKKPRLAKAPAPKKQKSNERQVALGSVPVILVPPAQPTPPMPASEQPAQALQSDRSSGSLFGPGSGTLTGKRAENAFATGSRVTNLVQAPSGSQSQQVARIEPQSQTSMADAQAVPDSGQAVHRSSGYSAQMAAVGSESEARAALDRIRSQHSGVVGGLSPRIVRSNVAGSTRYRVSFSQIPSRAKAAQVCGALIAAGERDCSVKSE